MDLYLYFAFLCTKKTELTVYSMWMETAAWEMKSCFKTFRDHSSEEQEQTAVTKKYQISPW